MLQTYTIQKANSFVNWTLGTTPNLDLIPDSNQTGTPGGAGLKVVRRDAFRGGKGGLASRNRPTTNSPVYIGVFCMWSQVRTDCCVRRSVNVIQFKYFVYFVKFKRPFRLSVSPACLFQCQWLPRAAPVSAGAWCGSSAVSDLHQPSAQCISFSYWRTWGYMRKNIIQYKTHDQLSKVAWTPSRKLLFTHTSLFVDMSYILWWHYKIKSSQSHSSYFEVDHRKHCSHFIPPFRHYRYNIELVILFSAWIGMKVFKSYIVSTYSII